MKTYEQDQFVIEMTREDINNLMMFCNSAMLRYREMEAKACEKKAKEYWDSLYNIKKQHDELPF